jgi:AraC family transcriptional regulator
VRRLRVDWALRELSTSARSLSEIALDAGFADQSHFTRVFKRQVGVSPGAFRRSARG